MTTYWRPVFTLSEDEGPEGGNFARIDAFEVTNTEDEGPEGVIRYEMREGQSQFLDRVEDLSQAREMEPNWFEIEFPVDYEEILDMEDELRGRGIDRARGRSDLEQGEAAISTYRAEFYDLRGVTEAMTRWNGEPPEYDIFHEIFEDLENKAMEHIFEKDVTFQDDEA